MTFDMLPLTNWYDAHKRDLVWRRPTVDGWGVLVSEVMSQQTPVRRVEGPWTLWMQRWPTPADVAAASTAEVLRVWGSLGYPRRALRLKECAQEIALHHDNKVPRDVDTLLSLPGIGDYTARAIANFAYHQPVAVVDTNIRRVMHRLIKGTFFAPPPRRSDWKAVEELLPPDNPAYAATIPGALMELGALVCTAHDARCHLCPLATQCRFVENGYPEPTAKEKAAKKKTVQKFTGTDRQVRGKIMGLLRTNHQPVAVTEIHGLWDDKEQLVRCLDGLLTDGLAMHLPDGRYALPAS